MADHSWVGEDSTWEGWTTPSPSPGVPLGIPTGRKLPSGPPAGWVGEVRTMPRATDDTIRYAARLWPQVQPEDFDRTGKRRYVERATGIEFDVCHGNPLLGDDPEAADYFFVEDDSLWFLRRADRPRVRSQSMGSMGAVRP